MNGPSIPAFMIKPAGDADPALALHTRLGSFEIQRVLARGAATTVYLATDHALALSVAIQEYLPVRLVQRAADGRLHSLDARHDELYERGLQAFIGEARMLARCDHPALVRVLQLFEAHGTAYRVMPYHVGQRLLDLRRHMVGAPDEASLRALLDALLGALETIHRNGLSHGGVAASNILLLSDDRPLLLGPGAAGQVTASDLVDTLMASVTAAHGATPEEAAPLSGAAADLYALADLMRYCISGELVAPPDASEVPEPLAAMIERRFEPAGRPHYSPALLEALDAAAAPSLSERPISAAQFRSWIDGGRPQGRLRVAPTPAPAPAPAAPVTPPPASLPGAIPAVEPRHAIDPPPEPLLRPLAPGHHERAARVPVPPPSPPLASAPLRPQPLPPFKRWQQWLFGGALAALATGLIAFATGAWDLMPTMPSARPASGDANPFAAAAPAPGREAGGEAAERAASPALATASAVAAAPRAAAATAAVEPRNEAAAQTPAAPNTTSVAPADATPAAAAASAATAAAAPAPPVATSTGVAATTGVAAATTGIAAATGIAAKADTAAPPEAAPESPPAAPPASASAAPAPAAKLAAQTPATSARARNSGHNKTPTRKAGATATAAIAEPRAACAGKTEFALYRCMQLQCQSARWASHPQCVRLRRNDEVG